MSKFTKDQWAELIAQCKSSGLSDFEWCKRNSIPMSSMYYHLNKLRDEVCEPNNNGITCSKSKLPEQHEVIPLIIRDDDFNSDLSTSQMPAAKITINGISVDIYNNTGRDVIANIVSALNSL